MARRSNRTALRSLAMDTAQTQARKGAAAQRNLVRASISKTWIEQYFRHIAIGLFGIADGSDATKLLANLGLVIGLAAETERIVEGQTQNLRLLHGACRNVQMLCIKGYRWDAQFASSMDHALSLARQTLSKHPDVAATMLSGANYFHSRILAHKVDHTDISGADVYQEAA